MLLGTYYAQNYASIIGGSLKSYQDLLNFEKLIILYTLFVESDNMPCLHPFKGLEVTIL